MDRDTLECLIVATVVALIAHSFVRKYGWACLATILLAPLVCVVESFVRLQLPPAKLAWLPMVYTFLVFVSIPPATLIGLPFLAVRRYWRRRNVAASRP